MTVVTTVETADEVKACAAADLKTVIVAPAASSRLGRLSLARVEGLAKLATSLGLNVQVQVDILANPNTCRAVLDSLTDANLDYVTSFRVRDVGLAKQIAAHFSKPVWLILEVGHHNAAAIQGWQSLFGPSLEGVVLSHELPRDHLATLIQSLTISTEILGFGPIELLYTPRHLLEHVFDKNESQDAIAKSPEMNQRPLPVLGRDHGTVLLNAKDLFLLDHADWFQDQGLAQLRVDRQTHTGIQAALQMQRALNGDEIPLDSLRDLGDRPTLPGFFNANRTDAMFEKIGGSAWRKRNPNWVGDLVGIDDGRAAWLHVVREIPEGASLRFVGRNASCLLDKPRFTNSDGHVFQAATPGVWRIPFTKGMTESMLVFIELSF